MPYVVEVDNIKCGGCARSIHKALLNISDDVKNIEVDIETGRIEVDAPGTTREAVVAVLTRMGYPERGSVAGLAAVGAKAKSFVSCALGKLDK